MKLFAILLVAAASGAYADAGNIYIDAGSSGTKIITYKDNDNTEPGTDVKVLSVCTVNPDATVEANAFQGNSAFSIVKRDDKKDNSCVTISTTIDKVAGTPDDQPQTSSDYAKFILTEAKKALGNANNKRNIPALATAGNRIISKAQNNKIWGNNGDGFCGQDEGGYKFADRGNQCGTIAGTREALFEATAWHATHPIKTPYLYKKDRRAIFTSGGASAQISIPLYTSADVKVFKDAVKAVVTKFRAAGCLNGECTKILTPGGKPLPYFTQEYTDGPERAAADFIRYWPKSKIKEVIFQEDDGHDWPRNEPFKRLTCAATANTNGAEKHDFIGLGTISFIGLTGTGGAHYNGVAGGVNQIEEWAKKNDCALGTWDKTKEKWTKDVNKWTESHFDGCLTKFKAALGKDIIWQAAEDVLKKIDFKHYRISFGTASIQPKGLVSLGNKDPDDGAKKSEKAVVDAASKKVKAAHKFIDNDFNLFGIGRPGAPMLPVPRRMFKKGLAAVMEVTKEMCMKLGRGFGFGWGNTCAKSFWLHEFLALGISQPSEKKPIIVDFGDSDVAKGEAYGFKSKRNLRKREQHQSTLDVDVHTGAEMLTLGKQILGSISVNTLSFMDGAVYSF
jgi:hypothetical protein